MALSPKEMGVAMRRNMQAKTGKSMPEWLEILAASGMTTKKESVNYLKKEHGLGHFQANAVWEDAQGIDNYAEPEKFAQSIFSTAKLFAEYQAARKVLLSLGTDVKEKPCRTYIPYSRKRQFAILTLKQGKMILGLNLADAFKSTEFNPAENLGGSRRINFQSELQSGEFSSTQSEALKQAYEQN